jgi:cathepsin A (carboxypeptidase C)
MMGLFNELGPCILATESNYTYINEWSWNNNASVLFLDQPAGTGFSSVANGAALPAFDLDGAADFQFFLNMFFKKIFPQYSKNTIHIAGESYAGHMVPVYVNHILESRRYNSRDAFTGNISSIILVNALINFPANILASYPLLCNPEKPEFNTTICEDMALYYPECMKMEASCSLTYDGEVCQRAFTFCVETVGKYYFEEIVQGRRSTYNSMLLILLADLPGMANF